MKQSHIYKILLAVAVLFMSAYMPASAQNKLNSQPESLTGEYFIDHKVFKCKVKISREKDGTYKGQIFYVENPVDPETGLKLTDVKNPDKSKRDTPCDRIVLLYGLRYNEKKQCWDGGKVYDPTYGIKANASVEFAADGRLQVTGSLMGISEHVFWTKLK